MEEATPTPEATKRPKQEVVEETPPVERSPLAPEPEVQLPIPRPLQKEKPEDKEDQEITSEQNTRQSSAAPITTAPPPSEAKPSEVPTAPSAGISAAVAKAQASWHNTLAAHLNRYKRYPMEARARNIEGVVKARIYSRSLGPGGFFAHRREFRIATSGRGGDGDDPARRSFAGPSAASTRHGS